MISFILKLNAGEAEYKPFKIFYSQHVQDIKISLKNKNLSSCFEHKMFSNISLPFESVFMRTIQLALPHIVFWSIYYEL